MKKSSKNGNYSIMLIVYCLSKLKGCFFFNKFVENIVLDQFKKFKYIYQ